MSRSNGDAGFTVVELMITLTLAVLIMIFFITLFRTNIVQYLNLQKDSSTATTLAAQGTRLANVLRGVTGVVSASDNDLVAYSYFYPSDTYVSQIHYFISNGQLLATVTPMTANPPIGSLNTATIRNYTIIPNLYQPSGSALFTYYDVSNSVIATPVSNMNSIRSIRVNLAGTTASGGNQLMNVQVSLRNGKTNL